MGRSANGTPSACIGAAATLSANGTPLMSLGSVCSGGTRGAIRAAGCRGVKLVGVLPGVRVGEILLVRSSSPTEYVQDPPAELPGTNDATDPGVMRPWLRSPLLALNGCDVRGDVR